MNTDDATFEFEGRTYVNPQASLNEREQFINNLRDVQAQNTAEINQITHDLGTDVPSNIGGLGGSEGLWKAQYQTPQTDAQIANLRAIVQQEALNTATSNLQNAYQNKYKQAARSYYKRNKGSGGGGNGGVNPDDILGLKDPLLKTESTDEQARTVKPRIDTSATNTIVVDYGMTFKGNPVYAVQDLDTKEIIKKYYVDPETQEEKEVP